MTARPTSSRGDGEDANLGWLVVLVGIVLTFFSMALTLIGPIQQVVQPDAWATANTAVLLVTSVLLGVLWYLAPTEERRILRRVGAEFWPEDPGVAFPLVAVALIALVLLQAASISPFSFGIVLLSIKAIEAWNAWTAEGYLSLGVEEALGAPTPPVRHSEQGMTLEQWRAQVRAIHRYYFEHPWNPLRAAVMLAAGIGVGLAGLALLGGDTITRHATQLASAVTLVLTVSLNEVVAARWRRERNRALAVSEGPRDRRRRQVVEYDAGMPDQPVTGEMRAATSPRHMPEGAVSTRTRAGRGRNATGPERDP